jgi:hypothetical protein
MKTPKPDSTKRPTRPHNADGFFEAPVGGKFIAADADFQYIDDDSGIMFESAGRPPRKPTRPNNADGFNDLGADGADDNFSADADFQYMTSEGRKKKKKDSTQNADGADDNFSADGVRRVMRNKDGHRNADADFQYADGEETEGGEESPIMYISPRISDGVVTSMDTIEVRVKEGLFNAGDIVQLKHPNYNGKAEVTEAWDAKDGGGSAILEGVSFVDTGERNNPPYQENPIDRSEGTIQIVAENVEAEDEEGAEEAEGESSADGDFQYANDMDSDDDGFYNAKGKKKRKVKKLIGKLKAKRKARKAKLIGVIKKFKGKRKRLISKAEAKLRKAAKAAGKKQGLKGAALRKHIRASKSKLKLKSRGFDGTQSDAELLLGVDGENFMNINSGWDI